MPERVLIVGGDGLLGRAMAKRLSKGSTEVMQTTRRRRGQALQLDLSAEPSTWPPLPDVDAAIIAGGVTSIVACAREPANSARVNVRGAVEIARQLVRMNAQTIFLSSSQVFNGDHPTSRRDDERTPVSEYGRQKAETEKQILDMARSTAVLRISKVMTPNWNLLHGWRTELTQGRTIHPFSDFTLAPVQVEHVLTLVEHILDQAAKGIYQLSGDTDIRYADLAASLANAVGAPGTLVQPAPGDPQAAGFESLPRFSSLDMEIESKRFGIAAPRSLDVIEDVIVAFAAI